jgi:DNA polymerase I-like protein with 3'-5' exonuclease and polymerase domains
MAVACSSDGPALYHHSAIDWDRIVRAFLSDHVIMANAPFDVCVILLRQPALLPCIVKAYEEGRIHDVLTRERYWDIATVGHVHAAYNLGAVATRNGITGVDKSDPYRKRYGELYDVPLKDWPSGAVDYALRDATVTLDVWRAQEAKAARLGLPVFADAANRAKKHLALSSMTLRGFPTDQGQVEKLERRLRGDITRAAARLADADLIQVRRRQILKDSKAARRLALEAGIGERTESGEVSISINHIEAANLPDAHPLRAYAALTTLQAQRSKNIPVLRRPRLRTRYVELVSSGRTSSVSPNFKHILQCGTHEWTGTNLQNLPRAGGFRECLVPPTGHRLGVTDWSYAELVALAQVQMDWFGRSALGDVIRAGKDPHSSFAAEHILRIPIEQFDKKNPKHHHTRQLAKVWNFGRAGGSGEKGFCALAKATYGVDISPDEYHEIDRLFLRANPEISMYFDRIRGLPKDSEDKMVVVQPRSNRIRAGCFYTDACNTPFQGLTADAAGTALWRMWHAFHVDRDSGIYSGPPVNADGTVPESGLLAFVHDEIVSSFPKETAAECTKIQERIMIEAFAVWCPDVPVGAESHVAERYGKF